jgi:hypothetical protein
VVVTATVATVVGDPGPLVAVDVSNLAASPVPPHAAVASAMVTTMRRTGKEYHESRRPPVA